MTNDSILGVRLSRRAVGAAVLADEEFTFYDARHLSSKKDRVDAALDRYVRQLLDQVGARRIVLYAPRTSHGLVNHLRDIILAVVQASRIPFQEIDKSALLDAFGAVPPRTEGELRRIMKDIWPESAGVAQSVLPMIVEAAAAAMCADTAVALGPAAP